MERRLSATLGHAFVVHAARPSAASAAAGLRTQVRHPWQQFLKNNQVSEEQFPIKGIC